MTATMSVYGRNLAMPRSVRSARAGNRRCALSDRQYKTADFTIGCSTSSIAYVGRSIAAFDCGFAGLKSMACIAAREAGQHRVSWLIICPKGAGYVEIRSRIRARGG